MPIAPPADQETRAIRRLIAEVDSLDAWRNRTGRRIIVLFVGTFAGAVCLLFWTAMHSQPVVFPTGPRVRPVLVEERAHHALDRRSPDRQSPQ